MNWKNVFSTSADWGKFSSEKSWAALCPLHHPTLFNSPLWVIKKTKACCTFWNYFLDSQDIPLYLPCCFVSFRQKIQMFGRYKATMTKAFLPKWNGVFLFLLNVCLYSLARWHFSTKLHLQNTADHIHSTKTLQRTVLTQDCWSQYPHTV